MTDLHSDWKPEFEQWREGHWFVTNVRYPSGSAGCVSSAYPDGKWRISCDPSLTPYPTRDAAARAERTLAHFHHMVAARALASTATLATFLRTASAQQSHQALANDPEELQRFREWVDAGRPDANDFACRACSDAGQAWDCNRTYRRDRNVAFDGPN